MDFSSSLKSYHTFTCICPEWRCYNGKTFSFTLSSKAHQSEVWIVLPLINIFDLIRERDLFILLHFCQLQPPAAI